MNNPYIGKTGIGAYGDMCADEPVPEIFQPLLYPDDVVTSEDLDYFMGLATAPLDLEDLDLRL